jgi:peptide/nickel transport system permease protein
MAKFIVKRILLMIPILFGVAFLVFFILNLTPSDPATIILGEGATKESIDALNHQLGYDRPFFVRFFSYIGDLVLHLDMGTSYRTHKPVIEEIMLKLPVTVLVAFNGMFFATLIGVPLGVLSAVKQYSLADTIPTTIALLLAAVPTFWLGMLLMTWLSLRLGWLPSSGIGTWKHYVLPAISLALPYAAQQLRFTRSSMLETIRADYIRTARAKGATESKVVWGHAMKNALLPVITVTGMNFGGLIGGAVVCESLYALPGLGNFLLTSIRQKDIPAVMGSTMFLATVFALIMLIVDVLYALVDPRIKSEYMADKFKRVQKKAAATQAAAAEGGEA